MGKIISKVKVCLGRVVDILEASGAFDPGSNPGRGASQLPTGLFSVEITGSLDNLVLS